MKSRKRELKGLTFNEWTVVEFSHKNSSRSAYWVCICSCGSKHTVAAIDLVKGTSRSCRKCSSKKKTAIYNRGNNLKYFYIFKLNQYYKLGVSNDVLARFKHMSRQIPYNLSLVFAGENKRDFEKTIHSIYRDKNIKGEWFELTEEDIRNIQTLVCTNGSCEI